MINPHEHRFGFAIDQLLEIAQDIGRYSGASFTFTDFSWPGLVEDTFVGVKNDMSFISIAVGWVEPVEFVSKSKNAVIGLSYSVFTFG